MSEHDPKTPRKHTSLLKNEKYGDSSTYHRPIQRTIYPKPCEFCDFFESTTQHSGMEIPLRTWSVALGDPPLFLTRAQTRSSKFGTPIIYAIPSSCLAVTKRYTFTLTVSVPSLFSPRVQTELPGISDQSCRKPDPVRLHGGRVLLAGRASVSPQTGAPACDAEHVGQLSGTLAAIPQDGNPPV